MTDGRKNGKSRAESISNTGRCFGGWLARKKQKPQRQGEREEEGGKSNDANVRITYPSTRNAIEQYESHPLDCAHMSSPFAFWFRTREPLVIAFALSLVLALGRTAAASRTLSRDP